MKRFGILTSTLVTLCVPAVAATLNVPGQFPTIQAAINAANPDDVIIVNGGTYDPIVIFKPLTIIGDPIPTIDNTAAPFALPAVPPAISLQGPGSGRVRLVRLRTRGNTDGSVNYSLTESGISGGGFAELLVEDCDIESAEWFQLTGIGQGEPAIQTSVPYVRVVRSRVIGGRSDTDACDYMSAPDSAAGISAPASTVVCLDSEVRGGDSPFFCFSPGNCPGPCPCPSLGGAGGPGIVAHRVFTGGALNAVSGGTGLQVFCGFPIGKQPDGPAIVATIHVPLTQALAASGALAIGQSVSFVWEPASTSVLLLLSVPMQPVAVGGSGWLFLAPTTMATVPLAFTNQLTASVPNSPLLVGSEVGLQVLDPALPLTAPYFSVIEP